MSTLYLGMKQTLQVREQRACSPGNTHTHTRQKHTSPQSPDSQFPSVNNQLVSEKPHTRTQNDGTHTSKRRFCFSSKKKSITNFLTKSGLRVLSITSVRPDWGDTDRPHQPGSTCPSALGWSCLPLLGHVTHLSPFFGPEALQVQHHHWETGQGQGQD